MRCTYYDKIINAQGLNEILILPPKFLAKSNRPSDLYPVFQAFLSSRLIVTSDNQGGTSPRDLFLAMRRAEKAHPRGDFQGLCEKVVVFLEAEDFEQLVNP